MIGFTATTDGKEIIPAVIGVDIGCGVLGYPFPERLAAIYRSDQQLFFKTLDAMITKWVPTGMNVHDPKRDPTHFQQLCDITIMFVMDDGGWLTHHAFSCVSNLRCYNNLVNVERLEHSEGTLGGGNHFIEVGEDDCGRPWLLIHSGSRNLGTQVCAYYQKVAYESAKRRLMEGAKEAAIAAHTQMVDNCCALYHQAPEQVSVPTQGCVIDQYMTEAKTKLREIDIDTASLVGQDAEDYLHDMLLCQEWARCNRLLMLLTIVDAMSNVLFERSPKYEPWYCPANAIDTVHNYVEDGIIRKGAVSAKIGERLLVPLNMRDGTLVCLGKGNPEWNYSAPHGAGRAMSRAAAKRTLSMEEFSATMQENGIYSTTVCKGTLDEAPMAYKDSEEITKAIAPTATVLFKLRTVYNRKATE